MGYGINISTRGIAQTLGNAIIETPGMMVGLVANRVSDFAKRYHSGVTEVRSYVWESLFPGTQRIFDRSVMSAVRGGVSLGERFLDVCRPYATFVGLMSNGFYMGGGSIRLSSGAVRAYRAGDILHVPKGHASRVFYYFDFPGAHISLLSFALRARGLVDGLVKHVWSSKEQSGEYLKARVALKATENDSDYAEAIEVVSELIEWNTFYMRHCNSYIESTGGALNNLQLLSWGVRNIAETMNKWLSLFNMPVVSTMIRSFLLLVCSIVSTPSSVISIYRNVIAAIYDPRFSSAVIHAKTDCSDDQFLSALSDYLLLEKNQSRYYFFMAIDILYLIANVPTLIAFAGAYSLKVRSAIVDVPYGFEFYALCAGPINWAASSAAVGLLMYQKLSHMRYGQHKYISRLREILQKSGIETDTSQSLSNPRVELLSHLIKRLGSADIATAVQAKKFLTTLNVFSESELNLLVHTAQSAFFGGSCTNPQLRDECVQLLSRVFGIIE